MAKLKRKRSRISKRTKVTISKSGLKIDLPSTQASAVGEQIQTLFSPVVEGAGLIGDYIRFFRQAATIRAMKRVQEIATESGVKLSPVSPKIIVPWVEAVSLEDPNSPLIDWWANLLVRGASGVSLRPYLIELMKQIGPEEAKFLETLWKAVSEYYHDKSNAEVPGIVTRMTVRAQFGAIVNRQSNFEKEPWSEKTFALVAETATELLLTAEKNGVPIRLTLYPPTGGITWPTSPILSQMKAALDVSRALNVVEFNSYSEVVSRSLGEQLRYDIRLLEFSNLGVEFMSACRPSRPTKS